MNFRHVAVPALLGWYLLVPPRYKATNEIAKDAPLSQWDQVGSFDTAKECEAGHKLRYDTFDSMHDQDMKERLLSSRCISTDDPRLKEK